MATLKKDWKKKAITALMSVFILASFAAAVTSVVTNLASAQVEEGAQCPLDIEVHFAKKAVPVCYDTTAKQVVFNIENGITVDVEGAIVNIIGLNKAVSIDSSEIAVPKTGSYTGKLDYDSRDAGPIRVMKITPKIKINENEIICLEQALTIGNVRPCGQ